MLYRQSLAIDSTRCYYYYMTAIQAFATLGFSDVESQTYCELLRTGPSTGYRLAAAIGKAGANIYQALESLLLKGAVMVDNKQTRIYRAVPAAELIEVLEQSFKSKAADALHSLQKIAAPAVDDNLYRLKSVAQVLQRGRAMIAASREIVLFDLFPAPLESFRVELERAAAREVLIAGVTYGEAPALRVDHLHVHSWNSVSEAWPGQQITIVSDAAEYLVALLSSDGASVVHGIWTDSAYLACLQHTGLAAEIQMAATAAPPALKSLELLNAKPPGLRRLLGRPHRRPVRKKK
jgi:HTH-type transcriptional regulator, sugar sensing transcriptional regulator